MTQTGKDVFNQIFLLIFELWMYFLHFWVLMHSNKSMPLMSVISSHSYVAALQLVLITV